MYVSFQATSGLGSLNLREPSEVEVRVSLLLGHSGDSVLWSRTEVHLCVAHVSFLCVASTLQDI